MKKLRLALLLLLCLSLLFSGCRALRRPGVEQAGFKEEPTISLYVAETGEKKQIKMEEYIKGVVAAEMDPTWPVEALAAQAILARTFTLERMKSTGGVPERGTDASTSVEEFQAYDPGRINDSVINAVNKTRGETAKYQGRYIKAWFFSDAGGLTAASALEGLDYRKEPSPYVHSVKDPGSAITVPENKSWQAVFSLASVREAVKKISGSDPGPISRVSISKKGPSGRVMSFQIDGATVSGPALRLALGSEKMRSTLLTGLRVDGDELVMNGRGFGHGVGMSQWGARALASQGRTAEQIVSYFFKDIEVVKEWK
ncbi:MAG: SpoIID/LytB domain-containing protein [Peptococcaceae bacterium]|jgi:stage II sporulation protein D|nr:SpoIID/LytB domain-containing protein [Peptococcaceae bacterium]MDH7526074.1 SpoIID/LytB domain-containing protein [Peptococcaceae bacterium]